MKVRNRRRGDDRGSALVLVLVLVVVGSLIVLPVLDYAIAVFRANTVLSDKTRRVEAVKASLRVALAEPSKVYDLCGTAGLNVGVTLATPPDMDIATATQCFFIDSASAQDDTELRYGLATVRAGATPPSGLTGSVYVPVDPASTTEWQTRSSTASEVDTIWLPNLPTHALDIRSPSGFQMPAGFSTCTVYFPGTYVDPLTINGPTYFASGIYYFEREVVVTGGAQVVVGAGAVEGCSADQEAAFYAVNAPSTHNVNGLGATFVFGATGRLVVDGRTAGPVSLIFNERYVAPGDVGAAPSAGVSIATVNGDAVAAGGTLDIPGVLQVPMSLVGSESPVSATAQQYRPSTLVPGYVQTPPDAPTGVTAQAASGATAWVTWTPPANTGNSPITGYRVAVSSGTPTTPSCTTTGDLSCVVSGLTNGGTYRFVVHAVNAVGESVASAASGTITASTAAPAAPAVVPAPAPGPGPTLTEPSPVVEIDTTAATSVEVRVPGYVSAPQGIVRVTNPTGQPVEVSGGVLSATLEVADARPAPLPIGLINAEVQRKFRIVTRTTSGTPSVVSTAVVQVNKNGGWAVNSWEVQ